LGRCFRRAGAGGEGLVHVSETGWTKTNVHPGKIVATSEEVDPAAEVLDRVRLGDVVAQAQTNGIEMEVEDVLTGFIRWAELARDREDQRPDRFSMGQKVDARLVAVDRAVAAPP